MHYISRVSNREDSFMRVLTANDLTLNVIYSILFLFSCMTILSLQVTASNSLQADYAFFVHLSNKSFDIRFDFLIIIQHYSIQIKIYVFAHP